MIILLTALSLSHLTPTGIEDCRKCCGGVGYLLNSGVGALAVDYVWQVCAEGEATVMALTSARYVADIAVQVVQAAARRRQGRGAAKEGVETDGNRAGGFKGPMAYLAPLVDVPYEDIIAQAVRASSSAATAATVVNGPLAATSAAAVLTTLAATSPVAVDPALQQPSLFAHAPINPFARARTATQRKAAVEGVAGQQRVSDAGALADPQVLLALCRQRSLTLWSALVCSLLFEAAREHERRGHVQGAAAGVSPSTAAGAGVGRGASDGGVDIASLTVDAGVMNRCAVLAHEAQQVR